LHQLAKPHLVFGQNEVAVIWSTDFLAHWQDLLTLGRDDAIVLHAAKASILFFCHENYFEFGNKNKMIGFSSVIRYHSSLAICDFKFILTNENRTKKRPCPNRYMEPPFAMGRDGGLSFGDGAISSFSR